MKTSRRWRKQHGRSSQTTGSSSIMWSSTMSYRTPASSSWQQWWRHRTSHSGSLPAGFDPRLSPRSEVEERMSGQNSDFFFYFVTVQFKKKKMKTWHVNSVIAFLNILVCVCVCVTHVSWTLSLFKSPKMKWSWIQAQRNPWICVCLSQFCFLFFQSAGTHSAPL